MLGGDLFGIGLLEDGAHQRRHHGLDRAGHLVEQVAHEMGAAALPDGARQHGGDGGVEALVGVGDHQGHPRQAPGHQAPQERRPPRSGLGGEHVDAQDLPVPVAVDAAGHGTGDVDDAASLAHLLGQGVDGHIGVGPGVERPGAEGLHPGVQAAGHLRDLGLGDPVDAHGLHQAVHPPGRHPGHVGLGHHRHQRLLRPPAGLEQPVGEVAARPQAGHSQVDAAGPGVETTQAVAVAGVHPLGAALAPGRSAGVVGIGRHQLLGEGLDHLSDDVVATLAVDVFAQPRQRVQGVRDHRVPPQSVCLVACRSEVDAVVVASGGCSGRQALIALLVHHVSGRNSGIAVRLHAPAVPTGRYRERRKTRSSDVNPAFVGLGNGPGVPSWACGRAALSS